MTYRARPRQRLKDKPTASRRSKHATASATEDAVDGADFRGWQQAYAEDRRRGRDDRLPDWRRD